MPIKLEPSADMPSFHQDLSALCHAAHSELKEIPKTTVDDKKLAKLKIIRGKQLAADGDCFFTPYPWTQSVQQGIVEAHTEGGESQWTTCQEKHERMSCTYDMSTWFSDALCFGFMSEPPKDVKWDPSNYHCKYSKSCQLPHYNGKKDHVSAYGKCGFGEYPEFTTLHVFRASGYPHVGALLLDTTIPAGDAVLRSEAVTAVALLIHELSHRPKPINIPIIIYTIGHTNAARVTQFHFDGRCLVYRQSRVYDLKRFDNDAVELVLWMKATPAGGTAIP